MTMPYIPIDCSLHDEYESMIVLKKTVRIQWFTEINKRQSSHVIPIDIIVKNKEESLLVVDMDNAKFQIRLDRIIDFSIIK